MKHSALLPALILLFLAPGLAEAQVPLGPEFRVDLPNVVPYIRGIQVQPVVAFGPGNRLLVAWFGESPTHDEFEITARWFEVE